MFTVRNVFYSHLLSKDCVLLSVLALFTSCQRQPRAQVPERSEAVQPIMTVSLSLRLVTEGIHLQYKILFDHTFDTFRSEKFEDYDTFSISHQVVPDKAEFYEEVCQIIINWKEENFTCALHIPIRQSELEAYINPALGYQVRFTSRLPKNTPSNQQDSEQGVVPNP